MQTRQMGLLGVALAALAICCFVAVSEREARSPSLLLANGQKLYGEYPYPGYPYGGGYYPYGGYGGYGYGYPYSGYDYGAGYPYYPYYSQAGAPADDNAQYMQWAQYAQQQQYADYVNQAQYNDYVNQQQYINQVNAYNAYAQAEATHADPGEGLKVAKTPSLVYMGDFEMGGYTHPTTGGDDGGYNAPFDLNGDGQEVDNWGKVATQWKHKVGSQQLKGVTEKPETEKQTSGKSTTDKPTGQLKGSKGKKVQQKQSQLKHSTAATKAGKREMQLEERKLIALKEARDLNILRSSSAMQQRRPIMLASEQPEDYYWQEGYGKPQHPGAIPNEAAPFRPWYWKMGYDKFGYMTM